MLCLTIIGIPFGLQCFKLASFALWPFGRVALSTVTTTGCLPLFFNIIWLLRGGVWIAFGHIVLGLLLCLTIVGIPFGRQHFQLIEIPIIPFGKVFVYK